MATTEAFIEDVTYMVDNGAGWAEVVRRIGGTANTVERRLERHHRTDLIRRAKARDEARGMYTTERKRHHA